MDNHKTVVHMVLPEHRVPKNLVVPRYFSHQKVLVQGYFAGNPTMNLLFGDGKKTPVTSDG